MSAPLADRLRPTELSEVCGQKHILGEGKLLRKIAESGEIPNLIFFGPSGTGKTTVARILAKKAGKKLCHLNGTSCSTADIRDVIAESTGIEGANGVLLYLDEIQYLSKKQQQTLLEFIEDGRVTLIASTTENPYFYVYNAILSRSTVFEFKPIEPEEIEKARRKHHRAHRGGRSSPHCVELLRRRAQGYKCAGGLLACFPHECRRQPRNHHGGRADRGAAQREPL